MQNSTTRCVFTCGQTGLSLFEGTLSQFQVTQLMPLEKEAV